MMQRDAEELAGGRGEPGAVDGGVEGEEGEGAVVVVGVRGGDVPRGGADAGGLQEVGDVYGVVPFMEGGGGEGGGWGGGADAGLDEDEAEGGGGVGGGAGGGFHCGEGWPVCLLWPP